MHVIDSIGLQYVSLTGTATGVRILSKAAFLRDTWLDVPTRFERVPVF